MKIPTTIGSAPWKVGQWAILAVVGRPLFVFIYAIGEKRADLLTADGMPRSEDLRSLLSLEGYRDHCDRMREEWTGKQYREAIEKGHQFPDLHPDWPKWLAVASAPITEAWDIDSLPSDWKARIAPFFNAP